MERVNELLNPEGVAVVGASNIPGKWGFGIIFNILTGGYTGKVYPVNPSEKEVLGLKSYKSLAEVDGRVDLAIITLPREKVNTVIRECGEKNVKWAVVVASDYSETGEEGRKAEEELVRTAEESGVFIIGPNTMGIYSSTVSLHAMGSPFKVKKGKIGLISQSGNIGVQIMGMGERLNLGFSRFYGSGNEAQLTSAEFLEILLNDETTEIIALYIEGIKRGRKFYEVLKKCADQKPVVVLKSAKTSYGRKAALSHTGAMATDEHLTSSVFKQAGAIEVSNTEELLDVLVGLYTMPVPKGKRTCVITMGGGWGVVTAEACDRAGLELPELPEDKKKILDEMLPPFWSRGNPVDLVGTMRRSVQLEVLRVLAEAEEYDAFILMGYLTERYFSGWQVWMGWVRRMLNFFRRFPSAFIRFPFSVRRGTKKVRKEFKERGKKVSALDVKERELWKDIYVVNLIREIMKKHKKPVIAVSGSVEGSVELIRKYQIPVYGSPEKSAFVLAKISSIVKEAKKPVAEISLPVEELTRILSEEEIDEFSARRFLEKAGIPMVKEDVAVDEEEAVKIAEEVGYPVVLKVLSPDILHKTEAEGIKKGLKSSDEVRRGFKEVVENVKNKVGNVRIKGVCVQKMMKEGPEIIVGIHTDSAFGKVILFGSGGIGTELYRDVSMRLPPLNEDDIFSMVKETKIGSIFFEGFRGMKFNFEEIKRILAIFSNIAMNFDEIEELEVNPLIASEDGIVGVDALLVKR